MTREDIDIVVEDNDVTKRHLTMTEVANITKYVNVNIEMDGGTLDYYYRINVEDLLNSDMPESVLDELGNQGWAYDEKRENLIIFLKV